MIKLLLFNHGSTFGGSGTAFLKIMDSLNLNQYETVVYCAADIPAIADELEKYNVSVIRGHRSPVTYMHFSGSSQSVFSPYYIMNLLRIYQDKKKIEAIIDEVKPDIVMINSMTLCWIGAIARKKGVESICCFHRETYVHGLFGFRTHILKKTLDSNFDRIAFISRYDMNCTKLKNAEGIVIPDCVDMEKYEANYSGEIRKSLGIDDGKFYILFLGGISKLKGIDVFLNAIDQCRSDDVRGIILGGSSFMKGLKSAVTQKFCLKNAVKRALGFDDTYAATKAYSRMVHKERVVFMPASKHVEQWYAACDMVAFPSTKAHQAMPIYEAGAARKLIVISDYPNTREYIENEINGLTFKPGDSRELADKFDWAMMNEHTDKHRQMIEENRIRTIKYHNMINYASQVRSFLTNDRSC